MSTKQPIAFTQRRTAHSLVFALLALLWLALDRITKLYFESNAPLDDLFAGPFLGLVQFRLVYNTGAAWNIFANMTFMLGVLSLVISLGFLIYSLTWVKKPNWLLTVGAALVFAGGIGNGIDRFMKGYVVDFLELSFVSFPVFNLADVAITVGIVLALVGTYRYMAWRDAHETEVGRGEVAVEDRAPETQSEAARKDALDSASPTSEKGCA